jgi:hypothetical protein
LGAEKGDHKPHTKVGKKGDAAPAPAAQRIRIVDDFTADEAARR